MKASQKEFIEQITARHVEDCTDFAIRAVVPLCVKYGWTREVQADVLRAMTHAICDAVQRTAELYEEIL